MDGKTAKKTTKFDALNFPLMAEAVEKVRSCSAFSRVT